MAKSKIWDVSIAQFNKIVTESNTLSEMLLKLNLGHAGANQKTLKKRLIAENYNLHDILKRSKEYSHAKLVKRWASSTPIEFLLKKHDKFVNLRHHKHKLITLGYLHNICYICGIPPLWNNKVLVLQIDHINGNNCDNRIENIRLVCPNCHSQTATYSGKNIEHIKSTKQCKVYTCPSCGKPKKGNHNGLCLVCSGILRRTVDRPQQDVLLKQISELGWRGTARIYGVSDNAIRKWIKL